MRLFEYFGRGLVLVIFFAALAIVIPVIYISLRLIGVEIRLPIEIIISWLALFGGIVFVIDVLFNYVQELIVSEEEE